MRNPNIIIFSSRKSLDYATQLKEKLSSGNYQCSDWLTFFEPLANDAKKIALLPLLLKKIPTFDYAIIIAASDDSVNLKRDSSEHNYSVPRDNVIFEIGLAVMALGLSKVILLRHSSIRIIEDLSGFNGKEYSQCAIFNMIYEGDNSLSLDCIAQKICNYIQETRKIFSPIVIGSSCATASGFFNNFIGSFNFLYQKHKTEPQKIHLSEENIMGDIPFSAEDSNSFFNNNLQINILIPQDIPPGNIRSLISKYYADNGLETNMIIHGIGRPVSFKMIKTDDCVHIIDIPTTFLGTYETAQLIMSTKADDDREADEMQKERFTAKETDMFIAMLEQLIEHANLSYPVTITPISLSNPPKLTDILK